MRLASERALAASMGRNAFRLINLWKQDFLARRAPRCEKLASGCGNGECLPAFRHPDIVLA